MSDINGGQSPNPNGSPIFPGTLFTGPILAGSIIHSDGSGALAGLGETSIGTANVGYVQMAQCAAGLTFASATLATTSIVIPAQSQIFGIYFQVTTLQGSAATFSVGTSAGGVAVLVAAGSGNGNSYAQNIFSPSTQATALLWDNVGNTDVQITISISATGACVGTLTVQYLQGINNVS